MAWKGIVILSVLILLVAVMRAAQSIRSDKRSSRGIEPGEGDTIIETSYHSGGSGGGHTAQIRVPRDPQAYARLFVPKDKKP